MLLTRRLFLTLGAAAGVGLALPAAAARFATIGGVAFGSSWRLTLTAEADTTLIRSRIETIIANVDAAMSPYQAGSETSSFGRANSTDWMPLSETIEPVVTAALRLAELTDGAFDPTLGPLVGQYGFGPIHGTMDGTWSDLLVKPGMIRKARSGLTLDLCGIAKGHALDLIVAALDQAGFKHYLLELGGEVFGRGRSFSGRRWQIGIERPSAGPAHLEHLVSLEGMAIATSGDSANAYDIGGRHYSHIMDAKLRGPVVGSIASVSVAGSNAMRADAMATALMVMGADKGGVFAEQNSIDALFLLHDGSGLKTVTTGHFSDLLVA